jgi:amyloid beta precursor protein binding protein 1
LVWYLVLRAVEKFHQKYARYPGVCFNENALSLDEDTNHLYHELMSLCTSSYGLSPTLFASPQSLPSATAMETDGNSTVEEGETSALFTPAHALELVRYAAGEIHTTSAVIGGVAAQEVVKLLTHQYLPLNNTYVYNGIATCGAVYTF